MAQRDIIVIGASAGGIEALSELLTELPTGLAASVFIVQHISPGSPGALPRILGRRSRLPVLAPEHGQVIQPGTIYVAPPDRHLLVWPGTIEVSRGPRENRVRPAIDPLFRSAARAYGERVVGVILSGTLGDGSTGLLVIKARGGVTIAQDPDEALFDGMPRSAIRAGGVDHVLPLRAIADLLPRLVTAGDARRRGPMGIDVDRSDEIIGRTIEAQARDERVDEVTMYACPDCGGTLWQIGSGQRAHFQCHVGHSYSPEALLIEKTEVLESALWASVRHLTEKAAMTRQLAGRLRQAGRAAQADLAEEQALVDEQHIRVIRGMLLGAASNVWTQNDVINQEPDAVPDPAPRPDRDADGGTDEAG